MRIQTESKTMTIKHHFNRELTKNGLLQNGL